MKKVIGTSVDWKTRQLLRKLQEKHGFKSMSEAMRFALQQGLISQGLR